MPTKKKPTKKMLADLREALEAERDQLLDQVEDLDSESDIKNWRDGGFDDDPADTGSANYERERAQSLANHARRLLKEIDHALQRMDEGEYGRCERCGDWIERERLEAIPYATLCLEDKRRDETGR
ncbi:MAG: TraR/DksA C4-type zinc finger protein [Nitriliruptorales bacterium]|nr:TraR/DksA C4-type zinc finger protein [Nitriliruptorales bacterium]